MPDESTPPRRRSSKRAPAPSQATGDTETTPKKKRPVEMRFADAYTPDEALRAVREFFDQLAPTPVRGRAGAAPLPPHLYPVEDVPTVYWLDQRGEWGFEPNGWPTPFVERFADYAVAQTVQVAAKYTSRSAMGKRDPRRTAIPPRNWGAFEHAPAKARKDWLSRQFDEFYNEGRVGERFDSRTPVENFCRWLQSWEYGFDDNHDPLRLDLPMVALVLLALDLPELDPYRNERGKVAFSRAKQLVEEALFRRLEP